METQQHERPFELSGVNHLALVCRDMARTVEFYRDTLGMPLVKTIELPKDMGQHFFFDIGNGDSLAFFWFKDAPSASPGVVRPGGPARRRRDHHCDRVDEPCGLQCSR